MDVVVLCSRSLLNHLFGSEGVTWKPLGKATEFSKRLKEVNARAGVEAWLNWDDRTAKRERTAAMFVVDRVMAGKTPVK